jgi:hypothetical protein
MSCRETTMTAMTMTSLNGVGVTITSKRGDRGVSEDLR